MYFLQQALPKNKLLALFLESILASYIKSLTYLNYSQLILRVNKFKILKFLNIIKQFELFSFKQLLDLFATDIPFRIKNRFEVNYLLLSLINHFQFRLLIKLTTSTLKPLFSVSEIFASADWLEREVWDFFGIFFLNHPDLRRILTDYGFAGYPLRKDFPVTGFLQISYKLSHRRLVYEPLKLQQELRFFEFKSPWIKTTL